MTSYATIETGNAKIDTFGRKSFLTERDAYQDFLNLVVDHFSSPVGYLHLYREATEEIELAVWSDGVFAQCTTSHVSHYPLKMAGIWADSIRKRAVVTHNDYLSDASHQGLPDGHFPIRRHMGVPIFFQGRIVAVIGIGNRETAYTEKDANLYWDFVHLGWPTLQNRLSEISERYNNRKNSLNTKNPEEILITMISAIGRALELRDEYTSQHQSNVAYLSERIAEIRGLPEQQRIGIRLGALIHDIGKIAIPSQILNKPGKLYAAEFEMIKMHPKLGADIFRGIDLPWPLIEMIEQHHERMDGTGYPAGLIGDSICLEARILAVADTFDAMASDRPYRHAAGKQRAVEELLNGRGIAYDTYVVDALLALLESDPILRRSALYK